MSDERMKELNRFLNEAGKYEYDATKIHIKKIVNDLMDLLHDVQVEMEGDEGEVLKYYGIKSNEMKNFNFTKIVFDSINFPAIQKKLEKELNKQFGA